MAAAVAIDAKTADDGPAAPRYNIMDRNVQPPGYHVYREKKETYAEGIWHLSLAECCFWVFPCLDACLDFYLNGIILNECCPSSLNCCLGLVNSCVYYCVIYVGFGRFCPGRRYPCCCEYPCWPCEYVESLAAIDQLMMQDLGPGWITNDNYCTLSWQAGKDHLFGEVVLTASGDKTRSTYLNALSHADWA